MSSARNSNDSSWGRRTSMLALSALGRSSSKDASSTTPKLRRKAKHARTSSLMTDHSHNSSSTTSLNHPDLPLQPQQQQQQEIVDSSEPLRPLPSPVESQSSSSNNNRHRRRPSLNTKVSSKRPSSVFDSLRMTTRSSYDESPLQQQQLQQQQQADYTGEPLSAVSTTAPSLFGDVGAAAADGQQVRPHTVLMHGEVQTSAGMFRKKKEYLVLTETHILRYKSQVKASEVWKAVPSPVGKPPYNKHGSMTSMSSYSDTQTLSESSGDKDGRVSMRQVVAIQRLDDGKPYFAIEVAYLDEESGQASALTLQFGNPEERDGWLGRIRAVSHDARMRQQRYMSTFNLEHAARIVERDNDYDPNDCAIYKIVQRQTAAKSGRSSADDLPKAASAVCLLAVGVHKVHIIQLAKTPGRNASPALTPNASQTSYGILSLTALKVSSTDDGFELTFRQPLQKPRHLFLASSAAFEIAARLYNAEGQLRPECGHRLFKFTAPREVEDLLTTPVDSAEEHSGLDRTLAAYCISYGLNPSNVRYTIDYECEDAPRFELLPPADTRRPDYGPIALLAIMRSLRYNETFGSISFANISLDSLNGLHDSYGKELVCSRTKRGTPIRLPMEELAQSSLLVQEVRALAATSKRLRRMNFSNSIFDKAATPALEPLDEEQTRVKDIGCGIIEALVPLCRQQTTNVDWICLNGIQLSETDLDYLVSAAVDKSCHFRAIELNRCGLNDRSMSLILDALRAQDNTIEAIEIGGNTARLNPATFDSQLSIFGFVRKLNLSYVPRTSGTEPLLTAETLLIWRLQELRFSGTALNQATINAVATYLAHPQSTTLHELYFDHAYLSGADVAALLHGMSQIQPPGDGGEPGAVAARDLHLDISQNPLSKDLDQVTAAITQGFTPSHLSMRAIEYREETLFRKMLAALTANKTIRYLDMSQTALPGDAGEETCRALGKLLGENDVLLELDLSGEDSRLASSKFGPGINDALLGLKLNKTLQSLRIEKQKLGLQGASTLAEVLKENSALRELHCNNNEIPLHGLTDLVNSLIENSSLIFLPPMDDGRAAAFKAAERTMKAMADFDAPGSPSTSSSPLTGRARGSFSGVSGLVGGGSNSGSGSGSGAGSATGGGSFSAFGSAGGGVKRGLASVRRSAARTASAYTPSFPALPIHRGSAAAGSSSSVDQQGAGAGAGASSAGGGGGSSFSLTLPSSRSKARDLHSSPLAKEAAASPTAGFSGPTSFGSTSTAGGAAGSISSPTPFSASAAAGAPAVAGPAIAFSVQDIQTTHRLLSEQWDRQVYRLAQYLQRNWCLLNGLPVKMEVEDEVFERPGTGTGAGSNAHSSLGNAAATAAGVTAGGTAGAGSLAGVLNGGNSSIKGELTPRAERQTYFDANSAAAAAAANKQRQPSAAGSNLSSSTASTSVAGAATGNGSGLAVATAYKEKDAAAAPILPLTPSLSDPFMSVAELSADDADDVDAAAREEDADSVVRLAIPSREAGAGIFRSASNTTHGGGDGSHESEPEAEAEDEDDVDDSGEDDDDDEDDDEEEEGEEEEDEDDSPVVMDRVAKLRLDGAALPKFGGDGAGASANGDEPVTPTQRGFDAVSTTAS